MNMSDIFSRTTSIGLDVVVMRMALPPRARMGLHLKEAG
jgi:hypothetical protein